MFLFQPSSSEDHVAPPSEPEQGWPAAVTKSHEGAAWEADIDLPWPARAQICDRL